MKEESVLFTAMDTHYGYTLRLIARRQHHTTCTQLDTTQNRLEHCL